LRGGPAALAAGVSVVIVCYALLPLLSRWGAARKEKTPHPPDPVKS
jgi:hypothetical protein